VVVPQRRFWVPAWPTAWRLHPTQTLLLCSGFVTLGFFIFCTIVLLDARGDAARQAEQAASNIAASVEQDVSRNIELFDLSLQGVSDGLQLPELQQLSPQIRSMVLFDRAARARYLGFINALNEAGDVIADSESLTPRGGNFATRDYFIVHRHDPRNNIYIGKPFSIAPNRPGSISISRRMSHPDGTFAGVVVGSFDLAYFRDLFAKLAVGPHGSITLFRTDGTILMRAPFDANDIGRTIGAASVFYDFMRTSVPRFEAESQVDQVLRRFNYRLIGDLPLVLSVGFAVDDIFAAWRVKATGILGLVALLCLANFGLTILLCRQLRQRAAAEITATQSAAEFRRLTESVSDIVARVDNNGVYNYVSPASLRVLGVAPEALIGRRLVEDLHPDDRGAFELWLARLQHDAAEPTIRFRKRRTDGADVWIEAAASRLIDCATASPQGFVIVSRDVTARHLLDVTQAERAHELEQSNAQLAALAEQRAQAVEAAERAVAVKTRFLATMSHEVRTPLNSILGYAELLALEGNLDPVQTVRLEAMRSAGGYLRDVVNDVLNHSRVEAQGAQATPYRTDPRVLIEQCRAQIEPGAAAKGLRLRCDVAPDVPRVIFADGTHLRQILINLLQNAVKFTRQGEIALRVSSEAQLLRCIVTDTGPGVAADRRDRLFHEYDRLDADRAGIEGTGLGLTIAARLAKGMGGRIGYDDNPVGGAMFWLEVPVGTPTTLTSQKRHSEATASQPLRVLVVDDSMANRDVAASFLRGAGHTVTEASSGAEAVHLADVQDFDVVLMDMSMPGMDGLEATRCIRAHPGVRGRVPIVAVTAHILDGQWTSWRSAGIDDYLAKPYERAELLAAVATAALPPNRDATAAPRPQPLEIEVDTPPLLDAGIVAQLEACMAPDLMGAHEVALAEDIEALLRLLDDRSAEPDALEVRAHKVAGDAGQLGWMALGATAHRFLATRHGVALEDEAAAPCLPATQLAEVAARSLAALRQRLGRARDAATTSAAST
jgi:PAS domain S-box-containing protein